MTTIDFIVNKVLKRTAIASFFPVLIYTIFWAIYNLVSGHQVPYFNQCWWAMGLLILVPPFSQLPLWFFFSRITAVIRAKAKSSKKEISFVPFFKKGNYLPVSQELQYEISKISEGSVPKDINGTFLKNGPNPILEDNGHWFDGDGMVHAFNFKNGALFYCNRWT